MTTKKMNSMKMEILNELELSKEELQDYMRKLKSYRYVDELIDIDVGRFIRWINITDPDNIYLTNGGNKRYTFYSPDVNFETTVTPQIIEGDKLRMEANQKQLKLIL